LPNYDNPNSFALLLTCTFPLVFALFEVEKALLKRLLLMVCMGALLVSCVYTRSRGGLAGMLGAVILSVLLSRRAFKWKSLKVFVTVGAVAVFSSVVVGFILTRRDVTSYLGSGGEASAGDRLMAWVGAIRMFASHPLLGVGWSRFTDYCYQYGMDTKLIAHNTMLSVLAETGLLGITCFTAVLAITIRQLIKMRREWGNRWEKEERLILCNGVLVSLLCFLFNTSFSVKDHEPVYWAILALAAVLYNLYQRETVMADMALRFQAPNSGQHARFRVSRLPGLSARITEKRIFVSVRNMRNSRKQSIRQGR